MITTTETRRLERTLDASFAYLADLSNLPRWDPGVRRVVPETSDPSIQGATFHVTLNVMGRDVPMTYRIIQLLPPHRIVLEGRNRHTTAVDHITFSPEPGDPSATRITWRLDLHPHGMAAWFAPFSGPFVRRPGREALDGLVRTLATGPS